MSGIRQNFIPEFQGWITLHCVDCCCSVTKSCLTLCNPWNAACQVPPPFTISWSSLRPVSIESGMSVLWMEHHLPVITMGTWVAEHATHCPVWRVGWRQGQFACLFCGQSSICHGSLRQVSEGAKSTLGPGASPHPPVFWEPLWGWTPSGAQRSLQLGLFLMKYGFLLTVALNALGWSPRLWLLRVGFLSSQNTGGVWRLLWP